MTARPIAVCRVAGWWLWFCNVPGCRDHAALRNVDAGHASDDGRRHFLLWHTNDPLT